MLSVMTEQEYEAYANDVATFMHYNPGWVSTAYRDKLKLADNEWKILLSKLERDGKIWHRAISPRLGDSGNVSKWVYYCTHTHCGQVVP